MFAVIKTGGKQYKVAKNDVIKIEKVEGETGSVVVFDQVLTVTDEKGKTTIGTPVVKGMTVSAEVLDQVKDDKVIIFKKQRRQNYRRKIGHRQQVSWIRIQDIAEGLAPKAAKKATAPKKAEEKAAPKTAAKKDDTTAAAKKPAAKKTAPKKAEENKED